MVFGPLVGAEEEEIQLEFVSAERLIPLLE